MKKRILIIDDDEFKVENIKKTLKSIYKDCDIRWVNTRNKACRFISDNKEYLDLIILDWVFPLVDGARPEYDMGESILSFMYSRDIGIPTIICSSDMIEIEDENVIGTIQFDSFVSNRDEFVNILGEENIRKDNEEEVKTRKIK